MLKTTQEKKEVVRDFYFPFDFRGNVNNVKVRSSKGDGEIKTQGGKETWARLTANLLLIPDEKKVRLSVNYKVRSRRVTILSLNSMLSRIILSKDSTRRVSLQPILRIMNR